MGCELTEEERIEVAILFVAFMVWGAITLTLAAAGYIALAYVMVALMVWGAFTLILFQEEILYLFCRDYEA